MGSPVAGFAPPAWEERFVTDGACGATRLVALDADGDGDPDLVGGGASGWMFWFENTGGDLAGYHSLGHAYAADVGVADLNADGFPDLLARDVGAAWWRAGGPGGLGPEQPLPPISWGRVVAGGDLDGDGDDDLVFGEAPLGWAENLGGAAFGPIRTIDATLADVRHLVVADLDGDGVDDVVTAGRSGVSAFVNDGSGTAFTRADPTARQPEGIVALDVDGDGDLDLGIADTSGTGWLENVSGRLGGTVRDPTFAVTQIQGVGAGDVDGDGDLDLLTADALDEVGWRAVGGGGLGPRSVLHAGTRYLAVVAAIDLDGDGDAEVASAADQESHVRWAAPGAGTHEVSHAADGVVGAVAVDLDRDGALDVVDVTQLSELAWTRQIGGAFATRAVLGTPNTPRAVVAADIDGDGALDAVSAGFDGLWWVAAAAGGPGAPQLLLATNRSLWDLVAADLDGDGDTDLAALQSGGSVTWYENRGAGTVRAHAVGYPYGSDRLRAQDVDGDGDTDLLVSYPPTYGAGGVAVYRNDGAGSFAPRELASALAGPTSFDVGDLDGDGAADVVLGMIDGSIRWFDATGAASDLAVGPGPVNDLRVVDLDGDGDQDVVLLGDRGDALQLLENDGAGGLAAPALLGTSSWGERIELVDLDADGDLDVVVPALTGDAVQWFVDPWGPAGPGGTADTADPETAVHTGVPGPPPDHTAAPTVGDPTADSGPTSTGGPPGKSGCGCRSVGAWPGVAGLAAALGVRRRRRRQ